jgi:hypothetical protein
MVRFTDIEKILSKRGRGQFGWPYSRHAALWVTPGWLLSNRTMSKWTYQAHDQAMTRG